MRGQELPREPSLLLRIISCNLYDKYHDYFISIEMSGRYGLSAQLEQTSVDTEVVQVLLGLEMNKPIFELELHRFL